MAQDDPQPTGGISRTRKALLGVYAALDPQLERELRYVGVEFDGPLDAYSQLQAVAASFEQQRPRIHRIQLAWATMAVLQRPAPPADFRERLGSALSLLVNPSASFGDVNPVNAVRSALENAAMLRAKERWSQVLREASLYLHPELRVIENMWCQPELQSVDNEIVSRIETKFVVRHTPNLEQIAPAALPQNWTQCNDFFCELIRVPERDLDCAGTTGGDPSAATPYWRGVYEERVGSCPAGWFPDTFLLFTWARSEFQLVLCYELVKRRAGDRTVLKIDQGYIQVDQLPDAYEVSTVKYLLFDENFIPGGGQTLAAAACEIGWLDCAINQFTECGETISEGGAGSSSPGPSGDSQAGLDAGLQQVLTRCDANLRETIADAAAQFGTAMDKIRCGTYGPDDYVSDWAKAAARAVRDGSRSVERQIDYALRSLELAQDLTRRKDTSP